MADSSNPGAARVDLDEVAPRRIDDDAEIIAMVERGGVRDAVVALMQRHGDAIHAFCLRMVRDPDRAADVQQQVFLEAYRDLRTFTGKSALRTWLFSIARHRALDAIKSHVVHGGPRHTSEAALDLVAAGGAGLDDQLDQARLTPALEDCLGRLTEAARTAVLLRYVHDFSYEEMASLLAEKANTLQARVARAFPALRGCLEEKGISP